MKNLLEGKVKSPFMRRFHPFIKLEDGMQLRLRRLREKGVGNTNAEVLKNCVEVMEILIREKKDGENVRETLKRILSEQKKLRLMLRNEPISTEPFV